MKTYTCDFLIVGGGVAGLMAAIPAAKSGAKVIIAEKADTRRSGSGANGNDHYHCYIPQCHGADPARARREIGSSFDAGPWTDPKLTDVWIMRSYEIVQMWESIGIEQPSILRCHKKETLSNGKQYVLYSYYVTVAKDC